MSEFKTSAAQRKAVQRYQQENVENITYRVKRGKRDELKHIAADFGMSVNQLIDTAVNEYLKHHSKSDRHSDMNQ